MHKCDGIVLVCMDWRLYQSGELLTKIKERTNTKDLDVMALAGSSKPVLDSETRDLVFKHIELNQRLHAGTKVILTQHEDCGAYGEAGTEEKLKQDLEEAAKIVKERFAGFEVVKVYINLKEKNDKWVVEPNLV